MEKINLTFVYDGKKVDIQAKPDEYMKEIINIYTIKLDKNIDINNLFFLYNGSLINKELKLKEINNTDKNIIILVNNNLPNPEPILDNSINIICPICGEYCLKDICDYNIKLNCRKGHKNKILLDKINDILKNTNINCNKCKKNINEIFQKEFYKCSECNIKLCPLCKITHNNHKVIKYDSENYICNKHNEKYLLYCKDCNKSLCGICCLDHKEHNILKIKEIFDVNNIPRYLNKLKKKIDDFKYYANGIINILNKITSNFEIYYNLIKNYKISEDIQILLDLNKLYNYNKIIINDIDKIIKEKDIKIQMINLNDIYMKMTNLSKLKELTHEQVQELRKERIQIPKIKSKKKIIFHLFNIVILLGVSNTGKTSLIKT